MKLEAVNPLSPEHIHVATVIKVRGQYIWLNLEGRSALSLSHTHTHIHTHTMSFSPNARGGG